MTWAEIPHSIWNITVLSVSLQLQNCVMTGAIWMLTGGSDLLQNNETDCQVEVEFKLLGYDSVPSFLPPLAIKHRNTKAVGWTISHLSCRCLKQPPKTDARVPCLGAQRRCPQRKRILPAHICLITDIREREYPCGDSQIKILFDLWGFPHHFTRVLCYHPCSAECLCRNSLPKNPVPASLALDTVRYS